MAKETELKYAISDASFAALLKAGSIGSFRLEDVERREVHDVYADTGDHAIKAAGFAFRIRRRGDVRLACLKSLGRGEGLGHHRDEHETDIGSAEQPDQWPEGEARNLYLQITRGRPVLTEVEIHQTRVKRLLNAETGGVAEVSLDEVRLENRGAAETFYELEVELLEGASLDILEQVHDALIAEYELEPVETSKYERALALRNRGH